MERYIYAQTNWERYFGSPTKAAHTVSCLVDRWDAKLDGGTYSSEFTDRLDSECEYGLVHTSTLEDWLWKNFDDDDIDTCKLKKAHWDNGECTWGVICSSCGYAHEHETGRCWTYCPNCGARVMEVV